MAPIRRREHGDTLFPHLKSIRCIGGGSPTDAGKSAAILLENPQYDAAQLYEYKFTPEKAVPIIAINLTHGTGTEVDRVAVATILEKEYKPAIVADCIYPTWAIDDPALMTGLSEKQTRFVSIDAVNHSVEAVTSTIASPLSITFAREAIALVAQFLPLALKDPGDLTARYYLLYASMLAGASFDNGMLHYTHALEHPLSAVKPDLTHGLGLSMLLPAVIKHIYPARPVVLADVLAPLVPGLKGDPAEAEHAAKGVEKAAYTYPVTVNVTNLPEVTVPAAPENKPVTVTLQSNDAYDLPDAITVTMGGEALTLDEDYTYDSSTGEVKINSVTGPVVITAIGKKKPVYFTITAHLSHLICPEFSDGPIEGIMEESEFLFTLEPEEGYRLPDAIKIRKADTENDYLVAGTDYEYSRYSDTYSLVKILSVNANLIVEATAIADSHYEVVFDMSGVKYETNAEQQYLIDEKPSFTLSLSAATGHTYVDDGSITVKMGDEVLEAGTDYIYVPENDSFELKVPLRGTLTISAQGTKERYPITVVSETIGTSLAEDETVEYGGSITFEVIPRDGYELLDDGSSIVVSVNGDPHDDFSYDQENATITINNVTGPVSVTLVGTAMKYAVTLNLMHLVADEFASGTLVEHGQPLDITLVAQGGYILPEAITVTMGEQPVEGAYQEGKIHIEKVTGPVVITAVAANPVTTGDVVYLTSAFDSSVEYGETLTGTLTAGEGYRLPYRIEVLMGGSPLSSNAYTYNNVSSI